VKALVTAPRPHHRLRALPLLLMVALATALPAARAAEPVRAIEAPISGTAFQSDEIRALQADEFANPALLWIDRGRTLWTEAAPGGGPACASCHGENGVDLAGAATRYPRFDEATGGLLALDQRINRCRETRQGQPPLPYESDALLGLTAFVANLSHGLPMAVAIDGPARPFFDAGRDYYYARRGQLNLACSHCHETNWGRMLRGDRLSQGHGNGYPIYRLEWQSMGSLHRRLRACNLGVRASALPYGSPEYVSLELFLAWRAAGLPVETPAVRR
jgi:sulfur-oxidizing protein SoxA